MATLGNSNLEANVEMKTITTKTVKTSIKRQPWPEKKTKMVTLAERLNRNVHYSSLRF